MLRISQVEAGNQREAFRLVDLTDIIETVCEAYVPDAEDSGRSLRYGADAGVTVDGDRELLVQLFANLVENALGHTPRGTRVDVRLSRTGSGGTGPVAEVSDDGPGIPECERDKVFRRFYRLEQSRTTPGNGLGLSTVAAIAKLHGAEIRLSDTRPGLRVTIRFPSSAVSE